MANIDKDNQLYLRHILEAIEKIERYITDKTYEAFVADEVLVGFVTYELAIIGEASAHLSDDFREEYAMLPWAKIIGTRNKLIHGYANIENIIVWQTAKEDLPILKKQIEEII